jgi:DNA-directed RNA polymerase subunit RPC12/RpoP
MIECAHCDAEIEDVHDTTYANYNSGRAVNGQHTGNIYKCLECDELSIDDFLSGSVEAWGY